MSETNSEIVWYIAREGQQHGPLTDAEMRLFVQSGHLKPSDLVWNQEMTDWQAAETVFPEATKPPAQPPPPPPKQPERAPPADPGGVSPSAATTGPGASSPTVQGGSTVSTGPAAGAAHDPSKAAAQQGTHSPGAPGSGSGPVAGGAPGQYSPGQGQGSNPQSAGSAMGPAGGSQRLPSPDEVLPTFRQEDRLSAPLQSDEAANAGRQPAPVDDYEDEDDEPRRGRFGMAVGLLAVAAIAVGGGVLAYQNQDAILGYMNQQSADAADKAPPVIKAGQATKTAAVDTSKAKPAPNNPAPREPAPQPAVQNPQLQGITVTIPPSQPGSPTASADAVPLPTIDKNLQKSQLWRVVKSEFPQWYDERVKEISELSNSASETDLSKHLIGKLVALRRNNAKHALASSTEDLQSIAEAFLTNLKSLAGHSTEACYTFISKGETSPSVIALFPKPGYGDAIEGQIAAVFRAVASGRKSPVERAKAGKADYDALAAELTKLGWSKADLGLFANPQALAKAPPEQVCKMVQDWFTAHVSISDKSVQDRLLVETLRPVVAG
ncbi:MAG: GYF domain-containing protein [Filomicrobium sp.]